MNVVSTCLPILVGLIISDDDVVAVVVVMVLMVIVDEGDIVKPTYVPGATV